MPRLAPGIRLSARLFARLGLTAACLLPAVAAAQDASPMPPAGNLPIDTFRPAIDSRGFLTVNASQPLGHGELSFGLGALSWGRGLLALEDGANRYSVDNVVTATLGAALGLKLGPIELELGASVPLSILSGDRGPDDADKDYKVDGQGLGNAGLHLKTRLLSPRRGPGLGVGLIASVYLPTTGAHRLIGDGEAVPQLVGVVDKELAGGRLRLALNGGVRLRSGASFTDAGEMGMAGTNRTVAASAELPLGFAASWAVAPGRFEVIGEVFGAAPLGARANYQPLEALGGVKLYLAKNSFLSLGAGRGLAPQKGGSPDARAFIGIVFEPKAAARAGDRLRLRDDDEVAHVRTPDGGPRDRDEDGIYDHLDGCPDEPEDLDGFADADGCPDTDDDRDGLLDIDDLCPQAAEDFDGRDDEDGCPDRDGDRDRIADRDRPLVVEQRDALVVMRPINFEYDRDVIKRDSYGILDEVAAALRANPDLLLVEIAGHTDEQGSDAYNLDLSIRRAASVRRYLTAKGVDATRLEAQGYGETLPIDRRGTQAAFRKNRRVEFLILKRR